MWISDGLTLLRITPEILLTKLNELHHADIAEILEELNVDQSIYIIKLLESDKTSEILMELDEDFREQILNNLPLKKPSQTRRQKP